jgi:hypothetical protein
MSYVLSIGERIGITLSNRALTVPHVGWAVV